jgi:hypothetical protein
MNKNKVIGNLIQLAGFPAAFLVLLLSVFTEQWWMIGVAMGVFLVFLSGGSYVHKKQPVSKNEATGPPPLPGAPPPVSVPMAETGGRRKKPAWMTVISVLGLVLSVFGIMSTFSVLTMPLLFRVQSNFVFKQVKTDEVKTEANDLMDEDAAYERQAMIHQQKAMRFFENMTDAPRWYFVYNTLNGLLQLAAFGWMFFSCIMLLQNKSSGVRFFVWAGVCIVGLNVVQLAVALASWIPLSLMLLPSGMTWAFLFILLMIVMIRSDKSFPETVEYRDEAAKT